MEVATRAGSNGAVSGDRSAVKKVTRGVVTQRLTWDDVTQDPENPIYEGRLKQMAKEYDGYNHAIVGVPELADNTNGAFPHLPAGAGTLGNVDANHRQELAARYEKTGEEFIAKIHRGLTEPEMLELKAGLNKRRTVKPAEQFLNMAKRKPHSDEARAKEIVDGLGWHVAYEREDRGLTGTNAILWIWRQSPTALVRAIQSYEDVFGTKPDRNQVMVLKGLGAFWIKYPDADPVRLVKSLQGVTAAGLYRAGKNQHDNLHFLRSTFEGIRYTLTMGYNKIRRSGHLVV